MSSSNEAASFWSRIHSRKHVIAWLWWCVAPILTVYAYRDITTYGFLADANFLIRENTYIRELSSLWDNLRHDYFWSSSGSIIPYWRPVTKGSWVFEYQFFQDRSAGYMLVQLAWHLIAIVGVQFLARSFEFSRRWALVSGLFFGLSPIAIEPVSLLMARSDVVCVSGVIWAMACWVRWVRSRRIVWLIGLLLAHAIALGSKETAIIVAPLITVWTVLYIILDRRASSSIFDRIKRDALGFSPSWFLTVAYWIMRSSVLKREHHELGSVALSFDPLRIFATVAFYFQNLLPFRLTSTIRNLPHAEAQSSAFVILGLITFGIVLAIGIWFFRRKEVSALGLCAWGLCALAPVVITSDISVPGVEGKFPLAERWLYHALASAALISVMLLKQVPWVRMKQGIIVGSFIWAIGVIIVNHEIRAEYVDERGQLRYEDRVSYFATPKAYRTREDECRFLDRLHLRATWRNDLVAALHYVDRALIECREDDTLREFYRFSTLIELGRFQEAEPLAKRLLEKPPREARVHGTLTYLAGLVFVETAQGELAERWLASSRKLGNQSCQIEFQAARAALSARRPDLAALRYEQTYLCGGSRDPALLITATLWWIHAGRPDRAQRLMSHLSTTHTINPAQTQTLSQLEAMIRQ